MEINAGQNETVFQGVLDILEDNRFQVMYRKQLERLSASGTVGAYLRLEGAEILENGHARGGKIRINYVNAAGIVPLTIINDDVVDCAFVGYDVKDGKTHQMLVIFKKKRTRDAIRRPPTSSTRPGSSSGIRRRSSWER